MASVDSVARLLAISAGNSGGGGGTGGTSNYPELANKPRINGVELVDNKTSSDLGIGNQNKYVITYTNIKISWGGTEQEEEQRAILNEWWQEYIETGIMPQLYMKYNEDSTNVLQTKVNSSSSTALTIDASYISGKGYYRYNQYTNRSVVCTLNSTITEITQVSRTYGDAIYNIYDYERNIHDELNRALSVENEKEYTPTGDYNPATKKYVDDQVESVTYAELQDKPQINSVELSGNKSLEDLGIGLQTYVLEDNSQENPLKLWEAPLGNYLKKANYPDVSSIIWIQIGPDKEIGEAEVNLYSPFVYFNKIREDGTTESGINGFGYVLLNLLTTSSRSINMYNYSLNTFYDTGFSRSTAWGPYITNSPNVSSVQVQPILKFTKLPQAEIMPTYDNQLTNKAYVDGLVSTISTLSFQVVTELPTTDIRTNIIYLVPSTTSSEQNVYDEYIYINNAWEKIGTTAIDASNYLAKDNTLAYAPTGDYNPATKKYVDDLFGQYTAQIMARLETLTNPSSYDEELSKLTGGGAEI